MKEFDIRDFIWNIYEICEFHKLTNLNLAFDMFVENLNLGYDRYEGTYLNYEELHKTWSQLSDSYQMHEKMIFKKVLDSSYGRLCDSWNKKDKENFNSICRSVRTKYGLLKIN